MNNLKALLFDLDGTLIDSSNLILDAFHHTSQTHNLPQTKADFFHHLKLGRVKEEIYEEFIDSKDIDHLITTHNIFQNTHLERIEIFADVQDVLHTLHEKGFQLGIVTTKGKARVEPLLQMHELAHYFETVITLEDITNPKPHPEPILKALEILKIKPEEAAMIGDSPADIKAGKAAGVKTVAVTYGFYGENIHQLNPDYVIGEIKELITLV